LDGSDRELINEKILQQSKVNEWILCNLKRAPLSVFDRDCAFLRHEVGPTTTYDIPPREMKYTTSEHDSALSPQREIAFTKKSDHSEGEQEDDYLFIPEEEEEEEEDEDFNAVEEIQSGENDVHMEIMSSKDDCHAQISLPMLKSFYDPDKAHEKQKKKVVIKKSKTISRDDN
jgi:hypothetical protein